MTNDATPAKVRLTDELGPLPPLTHLGDYTNWGYDAHNMRSYARREIQRAVAAERERCAKLAEAMDADYLRTSPCRKALARVAAAIRDA